MLCRHEFIKRNLNEANGGPKRIVWICKYCGNVEKFSKNNRKGSRYIKGGMNDKRRI